MTYVAAHAAGIALLVFAFYGAGSLAARVWQPLAMAGPRTGLTSMAVGIAAWAYLLLVLASVGLYRRGVLIGLVAVVAIVGSIAGLKARAGHFQRVTAVRVLAWLPPAIVLAQLFVHALGPYLGWDDMTAHLTLPKIYLAHG